MSAPDGPAQVDPIQAYVAAAKPTDDADEKTRHEQDAYERAHKKLQLNPTGRHLAVSEELLDALRGMCERLQSECDKHEAELSTLRPKYAALRESHRGLNAYGLVAAISLAVGSALISSPNRVNFFGVSEASIVGSGWGVMAMGCVLLIVSQCIGRRWKKPFDE